MSITSGYQWKYSHAIFDGIAVSITAKFSKAQTSNPTPQTVESVTKATAALRNRWLCFRNIKIIQSVKEVPNDIYLRALRALKPINQDTEGVYDPKTNSVYLIADNLASSERSVWVAIHEVVGHGGLRMLNKSVSEIRHRAEANAFVRNLADAISNDLAYAKDLDGVEKFFLDHNNLGYDTPEQAWSEFKKAPNQHGLKDDVVAELLSQRVLLGKEEAIEEAVAELAAAILTGEHDVLLNKYGVRVPIGMCSNLLAKETGISLDEISDSDIFGIIDAARQMVEGTDDGQ